MRTAEEIKEQVGTSMGDIPADMIITGGEIVNTLTSEIYPADIAIKDDRIVRVGDCSDILESAEKVLDASGSVLIPGFIDSHIHTESTLMTPTNFVKAALPRGTTSIVCDPHEIANVLGVPGLELFNNEAKVLPMEFMVELSSCVPAAPTLENGPNEIPAHQYQKLMESSDYFALAEMMNFPGVIYRDEEVIQKLAFAEQAGKIREGHAPGLKGKELQAYLTAGITSDHETYLVEEVVEKIRGGMKIQLREGSFARNLLELANGIKETFGLNSPAWNSVIICTDDKHADDILEEGHIDHALRLLINDVGLDPMTAIRICTLNPANHLRRQDLGAISPGRIANIVQLNNLTEIKVERVFSMGKLVAEDHQLLVDLPKVDNYPNWATDTVKPKYIPPVEEFVIKAPIENGKLNANVIGVIEHSLVTDHLVEEVNVKNGIIDLENSPDLGYFFILDRHDNTDHFSKSLVKGFKFRGKVAVASTVAHDSHQLLVTGNSPEAMEFAIQQLIQAKGGQIIVELLDNGEYDYKLLELPYAGLMSTKNPEEIAKIMKEMKKFAKKVTPGISEPFMSLSFMALPVIPALKLSDKGLVDVNKFEITNLFIQN